MKIESFEWDDNNIEHIARHGVSPDEVEEVCDNSPLILKSKLGRYYVLGQTDSGRYLTVIVQPGGEGIVRTVTARDMDSVERRRYQRR